MRFTAPGRERDFAGFAKLGQMWIRLESVVFWEADKSEQSSRILVNLHPSIVIVIAGVLKYWLCLIIHQVRCQILLSFRDNHVKYLADHSFSHWHCVPVYNCSCTSTLSYTSIASSLSAITTVELTQMTSATVLLFVLLPQSQTINLLQYTVYSSLAYSAST